MPPTTPIWRTPAITSECGLEALATDHSDRHIADGQMRKRSPCYIDASVHKPASTAKTFQPKGFSFALD
jgi:hypothetical protein